MNLGGCYGTIILWVYGIAQISCYSQVFGVYVYLAWTGLILLVQMTQNSCDFEYFKDYGYFCVQRLFVG